MQPSSGMTIVDKDDLPKEILTERTLIRVGRPADLAEIRAWPYYTGLWGDMSMTVEAARSKDGRYWWERGEEADRCQYSVVSGSTGRLIGVHALVRIDWAKRVVGNMGVRIHPDLCGKGYGTESLGALLQAVLRSGIRCIRLDVAATNERAVRCYQKCGMRITEEWWREGKGPSDPEAPEWAPLLQHFRRQAEAWAVRFYWMEILADPTA